jgi:hypothetical protein
MGENPKETEKMHRAFFNVLITEFFAECVLVNCFELVDCLAAQLLWRFPASTISTPQEGRTRDILTLRANVETQVFTGHAFS